MGHLSIVPDRNKTGDSVKVVQCRCQEDEGKLGQIPAPVSPSEYFPTLPRNGAHLYTKDGAASWRAG
jgi:hypothetical protein